MNEKISEFLWAYLFPNRCVCCNKVIDADNTLHLCSDCSSLFTPEIQRRTLDNKIKCISYCKYKSVSRDAILNLKFNANKVSAKVLGEKLASLYKTVNNFGFSSPPIVIPVPLSSKRKRERGFNQSEFIAKTFAKNLDLTVVNNAVKRIKHSAPQSLSESKASRYENIKGAYLVIDTKAIEGKNIIVIDDVVTTGSTLLSLTDSLKPYANKIICITVCSTDSN